MLYFVFSKNNDNFSLQICSWTIKYMVRKLFYFLLVINVMSSEKIKRTAAYKDMYFDTKWLIIKEYRKSQSLKLCAFHTRDFVM